MCFVFVFMLGHFSMDIFLKGNINIAIYSTTSSHTGCNSTSCPPWGASAKCVHQVVTSDSLWCSSAPGRSGTSAYGHRQRWSCSIQSEGWSQCWSELLRRPEWLSSWRCHMTTGSIAPLWRCPHANTCVEKTSKRTSIYVSCHVQLG